MPVQRASSAIDKFFARLDRSLEQSSLILLTLSKRSADAAQEIPERLTVRPVTVRGARRWQWTGTAGSRHTHENLDGSPTLERVMRLLGATFLHAQLFSSEADVSLRIDKSGRAKLRTSRPTKQLPAAVSHDREKQYLIPEDRPCPFLHELGVMTAEGRVHRSRRDKFRQINRFLEFVEDIIPHLPAESRLEIVDFGCGLSYLTFALHHLLTAVHGRDVHIVGIDQNPQVIERCRETGRSLKLEGLEFHARPITDAAQDGKIHLAVALHACDTATDDALAQAVRRQADVILAAPCCQHELAPQLKGDALALFTQHGILRERLATMATDALRAAALEAAGYRTQVIEFIDTEHTPKNLLIRAVRRPAGRDASRTLPQIEELTSLLGVEHQRLLDLLQERSVNLA